MRDVTNVLRLSDGDHVPLVLIDVASPSLGMLTQHLPTTGVAAVNVAVAITTQTLDRIVLVDQPVQQAYELTNMLGGYRLLQCIVGRVNHQ